MTENDAARVGKGIHIQGGATPSMNSAGETMQQYQWLSKVIYAWPRRGREYWQGLSLAKEPV